MRTRTRAAWRALAQRGRSLVLWLVILGQENPSRAAVSLGDYPESLLAKIARYREQRVASRQGDLRLAPLFPGAVAARRSGVGVESHGGVPQELRVGKTMLRLLSERRWIRVRVLCRVVEMSFLGQSCLR